MDFRTFSPHLRIKSPRLMRICVRMHNSFPTRPSSMPLVELFLTCQLLLQGFWWWITLYRRLWTVSLRNRHPLAFELSRNIFFFSTGTSAATPTFSSIISLINGELLNAGLKPLGFLNPWLYSAATLPGFIPITQNRNPGCGTDGFQAAKPWSPVAGLGSPKYPQLVAAAKAAAAL